MVAAKLANENVFHPKMEAKIVVVVLRKLKSAAPNQAAIDQWMGDGEGGLNGQNVASHVVKELK